MSELIVPAVKKGFNIRVKPCPNLLIAFLNEVGLLHQSLFEPGQTVLVDLLGVSCAQSLCVVQPEEERSQDVLLLLLNPPVLLHIQKLLQWQRKQPKT